MLCVPGPLVKRNRLAISVRLTSASRGQSWRDVFSHNKSLRPQLFDTSNISFSRGLRMSPSISNTRWLISASAAPKLLTTVVLPSPRFALLTNSTLGDPPLCCANRIEVMVLRKDSAITDDFSRQVASSTLPTGILELATPFGGRPTG